MIEWLPTNPDPPVTRTVLIDLDSVTAGYCIMRARCVRDSTKLPAGKGIRRLELLQLFDESVEALLPIELDQTLFLG